MSQKSICLVLKQVKLIIFNKVNISNYNSGKYTKIVLYHFTKLNSD